MSVYEFLSVVIAAGALLGVVLSLWLVRRQVMLMNDQTRQLRDAMSISAESALDGLLLNVTQLYLEHPELRPIFNEREALEPLRLADPETHYRACALAEALLDAVERALNFERRGLSEPADLLREWTYDSFRHSAFLRGWLDDHRSWYSERLTAILDEVTAERAETAPTAAR
ncbi:hypothetical protein O7635_23735 [Asanoa sp. WMMD1127]|uniref:hypothetical protein n=1 Tax=Asanoa sp. WMMD1127 TaxID=3016107 RepID=UPI00241659B0|nr:hypothetical protein [Asanoa sp. WMMD1127]MDG4824872.1 hypothetical protein [Asanoa sp. WMMD1127]